MESKFKYDAFISYRHTELDKFVAENLHKQLEAFRLPKSAAKKHKDGKTRVERVFRDKDELPLTSNLEDPIVQALQNSEWLIVICSPRLRESLWCRKEIETFVALRGREHVLAVLIEGEPSESFPDELLYKIEKRMLPGGSVEEVKLPVEPLAADVRGKTKKDMLKAMKTEILRLLATMFGVEYDDLRQRHRERKMRRIVTASLLGGAACLLFGVFSTATALRIQKQNEQIAAQSAEIQAQSDEIQKQSAEIQAQNEELALRQAQSLVELASHAYDEGDRVGAIQTALEALTESDGIALPYTPEAQMALTEYLRLYDVNDVYKADYQVETVGVIEDIELSFGGDTLAIYDSTGTITLFDVENREIITTISSTEYSYSTLAGCAFLGENRFAYMNIQGEICIYDLNERAVVQRLLQENIFGLYVDEEGKYLLVKKNQYNYVVYDGETLEELGTTPLIEANHYSTDSFVFSNGIMVCGYAVEELFGDQEYILYFIDLHTMQIISTCDMGANVPQDISIKDGIAYVASTEYDVAWFAKGAKASAIEVASGNILWEYEQNVHYAKEIVLPANEGAKYLNFLTEEKTILLDMQTGEAGFAISLPSAPRDTNVYVNYNSFLVTCEDGEMVYVDAEDGSGQDASNMFECKTISNEEIFVYPNSVIVLGDNDNKITVYEKQLGPDMVEIDRELSLPEESTETKEKTNVEIARDYGLDNPDLVNQLYYNEDNSYCFIQYKDNSFVTYDVEAGQVAYIMDWAYPTEWCLGTDAQGYTYLLGYYGCYVLNEKMECIMWIPEAKEVDIDSQKVYISGNGRNYEAPIYSLEELIEMAEGHTAKG